MKDFVRSVAAILAVVFSCDPAWGRQTPDSHRLAEFSQQLYVPVGSKRLTVVGDSINATNTPNRMSAGYRDAWRIRWNGWVVHADSGAADIGYQNAQNLRQGDYSTVWDPGERFTGGQLRINPVRTREINYAVAPWPGMMVSDAMLMSAATARFPAGDFFVTGRVRARAILFQDHNVMPALVLRGMRGSQVVGPDVTFKASGPMGRIAWHDLDLGEVAGAPRVQAFATVAPRLPGYVWDFWRFVFMGVLYRAEGVTDGVQMSFISHGGWRTTDHAGQHRFTDQALREYYTAIGPPTHLILWLGQNQTTIEANQLFAGDNTAYKANLRAVIDRHDSVIAQLGQNRPRWLLISPYKTGYDQHVHERMAQTMHELSIEDDRVSFLNLYALAGGEAFDTSAYTTDGIHPSAAGSLHLATIMDQAMHESVRCTADVDASGYVDVEDLVTFLTWFEEGDERADTDGSGFVDSDDRDAFMSAYEVGC